MTFNLWGFLAVASSFGAMMMIALFYVAHQQKMKKLEVESQRIEKANLRNEVTDAVKRELGGVVSRIEVLEAIVTDKSYELNEKITRLK